jgi:hypothetical protein
MRPLDYSGMELQGYSQAARPKLSLVADNGRRAAPALLDE